MAIFEFAAHERKHAPRKNLKTIPLAAALALSPFAQGPATADDARLLPAIATTTTIPGPPAGPDLNPYGIAFVPPKFPKGPLLPGDILVSNFNASSNVQGTGTTIIQYRPSPSGAVAGPPSNGTGASVFFQENGQLPGLTLALGVLQRGAIVVGIVNNNGTTAIGGPLLVLDRTGTPVQTIPVGGAPPSIPRSTDPGAWPSPTISLPRACSFRMCWMAPSRDLT